MSAKVSVIMGSRSDWAGVMEHTARTLTELDVPFETRILSAHRTPDALASYVEQAEKSGVSVFIAAAGGAAHLAGVVAALTTLPVLGVPIESKALKGLDSLLSMVQMPAGIPVPTLSIGKPGAVNAALSATAILALQSAEIDQALKAFRRRQSEKVLAEEPPTVSED